ncbi:MAG: hypothetical protein ACU0CO_16865 [Shimia sp.]
MLRFRTALLPLALLTLGACATTIPDDSAEARRDAVLEGRAPAERIFQREADGNLSTQRDIGGEGAPLSAITPTGSTQTVTATTGISREQDFGAVSDERSIAGDAAAIEANRERYRVVQPTAVPTRRESGPNIVQYALQTTNSVGQPLYRRGSLNTETRSARACAGFPSADRAQEAFLRNGGPTRDRGNLDPDGDGFACAWDPAPFRVARR